MMEQSKTCDLLLLNRFFDGELGPEEHQRAETHLNDCPSCRRALEEMREISGRVKAHLGDQSHWIEDRGIKTTVLKEARYGIRPWWTRFTATLSTKKILFPVGATAVFALAVFTLTFIDLSGPKGPTAIVSSVSGDVSNIVILETPKTRQTVLWFNESPERPQS